LAAGQGYVFSIRFEAMKNKIFERTGWLPTVFDKGTHYATNQRLTLETLKEISDSDKVLEVTGDYTGSIGGWELLMSKAIKNIIEQ